MTHDEIWNKLFVIFSDRYWKPKVANGFLWLYYILQGMVLQNQLEYEDFNNLIDSLSISI